jgi:hypothetical protein
MGSRIRSNIGMYLTPIPGSAKSSHRPFTHHLLAGQVKERVTVTVFLPKRKALDTFLINTYYEASTVFSIVVCSPLHVKL